LDFLGEIVPVLRRELDALRPADVPDAPTHASRLAAAQATARAEATDATDATDEATEAVSVDRWTGTRAEDANAPALR